MIARLNRKSFYWGVPGFLIQHAALVAVALDALPGLVELLLLTGTWLLFVGLAFYAKARGRHPAWGLVAFVGVFGIILLAYLKDMAPEGEPPGK